MIDPGDITVCYAVTPDQPYPRCAAASAYSAARATPGVRIRIAEVPETDYPWGVMTHVLPGADCPSEWVIMLNADTWVNGDLRGLIDESADIRVRVSRAWRGDRLDRARWRALLDLYDLSDLSGSGTPPVYSNGLIVCRAAVSAELSAGLPWEMDRVVHSGLPDPLDRDLISKDVPEWWMRDQYALSILIAKHGWRVSLLRPREWSFNFAHESGGIVHHLGTDVDPFGEKQWPKYTKT